MKAHRHAPTPAAQAAAHRTLARAARVRHQLATTPATVSADGALTIAALHDLAERCIANLQHLLRLTRTERDVYRTLWHAALRDTAVARAETQAARRRVQELRREARRRARWRRHVRRKGHR